MPSERIEPAANALLDTLRAGIEVLDALDDLYERQLDALRANDPDALAALATETQDRTATLDGMRQKSERQARLLGRVLDMEADAPSLGDIIHRLGDSASSESGERLAQMRTAVAERVQTVNRRRETLRLALEYASDLNHELLAAMKEAATETDAQTYTATGQSESRPSSDDRSFVNTTG